GDAAYGRSGKICVAAKQTANALSNLLRTVRSLGTVRYEKLVEQLAEPRAHLGARVPIQMMGIVHHRLRLLARQQDDGQHPERIKVVGRVRLSVELFRKHVAVRSRDRAAA